MTEVICPLETERASESFACSCGAMAAWLATVTPPAPPQSSPSVAGRITTHMRNVTELPARMDARWDCVETSFLVLVLRFHLLLRRPPAAAAAGLIDEDWGAGFTSGAARTPPSNSIQPVNWIQLSDQRCRRKADGTSASFHLYLHWN